MKHKNNTTKRGFSEAYKKIPSGNLKALRTACMQECEWISVATFYDKKNGRVKISKPEWRTLGEIFAEYNIDVKTGEYIKALAE